MSARTALAGLVRPALRLATIPALGLVRFVRQGDAAIRRRSVGNAETGAARPLRLLGYGLYLFYRAGRQLALLARQEWTGAVLKDFDARIKAHYGKHGASYGEYAAKSDAELAAVYHGMPAGRTRPFIETYGAVLGWADGESFLDCGCGEGAEVRELRATFPSSPVACFDLNEDAVRAIRAGTAGDPLVSATTGSLVDPAHLRSIASDSVDHVLLCHVIAYLFGPSAAETTALRQEILSQLIRIARKSVLVITDKVERRDQVGAQIVLGNACFVRDDLPGHFLRHLDTGVPLVLHSPGKERQAAILFRKRAG